MIKLKRVLPIKIVLYATLLLMLNGCSKNQNTFLPFTRVNLRISLVNFNHLMVPGNSVLFQNEGYKGIIVVCVDPNSAQYYAYDATCSYEKDFSGVVTIQPVKNLPSPPFTVFSSDFFGVCNKCGSEFNL